MVRRAPKAGEEYAHVFRRLVRREARLAAELPGRLQLIREETGLAVQLGSSHAATVTPLNGTAAAGRLHSLSVSGAHPALAEQIQGTAIFVAPWPREDAALHGLSALTTDATPESLGSGPWPPLVLWQPGPQAAPLVFLHRDCLMARTTDLADMSRRLERTTPDLPDDFAGIKLCALPHQVDGPATGAMELIVDTMAFPSAHRLVLAGALYLLIFPDQLLVPNKPMARCPLMEAVTSTQDVSDPAVEIEQLSAVDLSTLRDSVLAAYRAAEELIEDWTMECDRAVRRGNPKNLFVIHQRGVQWVTEWEEAIDRFLTKAICPADGRRSLERRRLEAHLSVLFLLTWWQRTADPAWHFARAVVLPAFHHTLYEHLGVPEAAEWRAIDPAYENLLYALRRFLRGASTE